MKIRATNRLYLSNKVSSVMIRIRKMPIMNMTKQKIIASERIHKIRRISKNRSYKDVRRRNSM